MLRFFSLDFQGCKKHVAAVCLVIDFVDGTDVIFGAYDIYVLHAL
jgi:hypothetical protein